MSGHGKRRAVAASVATAIEPKSADDFESLKWRPLGDACKARKLTVRGTKEERLERLRVFGALQDGPSAACTEVASAATPAMKAKKTKRVAATAPAGSAACTEEVEQLIKHQSAKLAQQAEEIVALQAELEALRGSNTLADHEASSAVLVSSQAGCAACARLSRQVDDMTGFLADHGLTWVPTTNVAQDTGHDSVRDGRRGDGFPSVSSGTPVAKKMCCPASPAGVVVEISKNFIETFHNLYICVQATPVEADFDLRCSHALEWLKAGDLVEAMDEPRDDSIGCTRVPVRVLKNGRSGWVTLQYKIYAATPQDWVTLQYELSAATPQDDVVHGTPRTSAGMAGNETLAEGSENNGVS